MPDQPFNVFFGAREITVPQEDGDTFEQCDAQRQRVVHRRCLANGLARAFRRLHGMALQPQSHRQNPAGQAFSFNAEIALHASLGLRFTCQRCLELHTGAVEFTAEVQRIAQYRLGRCDCRAVLGRCGDGRKAPRVLQGGSEIAGAQVEHVQRAQHAQLVEGIATFLGDREAPVQGHARFILPPRMKMHRHSERRLQMHLLEPAASGVVERGNRALRPAMAFGQQRHRQEHRRGGGGKPDADLDVAVGAKAPFQSRADIVESGEVRRAFRAGRQASAIRPRSAPASAGNRSRGARPGRRARRRRPDFERIGARRVQEPVAHHRADGLGRDHRLGDEAVDRAKDGRLIEGRARSRPPAPHRA